MGDLEDKSAIGKLGELEAPEYEDVELEKGKGGVQEDPENAAKVDRFLFRLQGGRQMEKKATEM